MNKERLPANIKSIITSIDNELQVDFEQYTANKITINDFIQSIDAIIYYYYSTIYKRVYKEEIPDTYLNDLRSNLDKFIDRLTTGIHHCLQNENLYDEILEIIAKHILSIYWQMKIQDCENNNIKYIYLIPNIDASLLTHTAAKIVTNISIFKQVYTKLDPLDFSILFVDKLIDCKLQDVDFIQLPNVIKNEINKLLFDLNKYQEFITTKSITFIEDNMMTDNQISISNGLFDIKYNLIYLLLKDKLLANIDEEFWRDKYARLAANKYIADECYQYARYLTHIRAENNYIEYFMSCIIAFILNMPLENYDIEAYNKVKRILTKEV